MVCVPLEMGRVNICSLRLGFLILLELDYGSVDLFPGFLEVPLKPQIYLAGSNKNFLNLAWVLQAGLDKTSPGRAKF